MIHIEDILIRPHSRRAHHVTDANPAELVTKTQPADQAKAVDADPDLPAQTPQSDTPTKEAPAEGV